LRPAYENLGDVYTKLASQAYDKALQLDSSNSAAKNKLSLIRDLLITSEPVLLPSRSPLPERRRPGAAARDGDHPEEVRHRGQTDRCKGRICGQQNLRRNRRELKNGNTEAGAADGARLGRRVVQKERGKLSRLLRPGFQDAEGRRPLAMGSLTQGTHRQTQKDRGSLSNRQGYVQG